MRNPTARSEFRKSADAGNVETSDRVDNRNPCNVCGNRRDLDNLDAQAARIDELQRENRNLRVTLRATQTVLRGYLRSTSGAPGTIADFGLDLSDLEPDGTVR